MRTASNLRSEGLGRVLRLEGSLLFTFDESEYPGTYGGFSDWALLGQSATSSFPPSLNLQSNQVIRNSSQPNLKICYIWGSSLPS